MEEGCEMIDLHCHILAGLDDGPGTVEESLAMARMGYEDGIRVVVATPHTLNGLHLNGRSTILAKVEELNEKLVRDRIVNTQSEETGLNSAIRNPKSELRVLPGADVRLCEKTLQELDEGNVLTVGDEGKYLLLEFPTQSVPLQSESILMQFLKRGLTPIITHPERNVEICRKPERYYEMIRMGCLGQVTAMSLTGGFGPEARRVAEKLLTYRLLHIIASDAHSTNGRPPVLSQAVEAAGRIIGETEARKMVIDHPQAILEGLSFRFACS
jgi:protein-tyrosine phosphatase